MDLCGSKRTVKVIYLIYLLITFPALGESRYELVWGEACISGESSGEVYSQEGSFLVTDGNEISGDNFTITEESVVVSTGCIIGFEDFARFTEQWLRTDCNEINNWCDGADMDRQDGVDCVDLSLFVDKWLDYCPDGWLLK